MGDSWVCSDGTKCFVCMLMHTPARTEFNLVLSKAWSSSVFVNTALKIHAIVHIHILATGSEPLK